MRSWIRVLLTILICASLPAVFAQGSIIRSGSAVITLVSGNIAGLIATETLINTTGVVEHTIVSPSILVTSSSALVTIGPTSENTTAITVANPSMGSGGVNLSVTNEQGAVILNTTFTIGPRENLSKYLNEFFVTPPASALIPGLLTISSEIPVAVLVLNFRNGGFASVPITSLGFPTPVPFQALTPATTTRTGPGFGLGIAPVAVPPAIVSAPVTASTSRVPTTATIGGAASLVFPQVVSGGGWSTEIAIGNTSAGTQTIRIDIFESDGTNVKSVTDITIPSRGVFFFLF